MIYKIIIPGIEGCQEYTDDAIVYGESWEQHLKRVRSLLNRIKAVKLTVKLM